MAKSLTRGDADALTAAHLADQDAVHLSRLIVFDYRELDQLGAFPPYFRAVGGEEKGFGTGLGRVGWATGFGGKRGGHAQCDDLSKPAQDTKSAMSAPPDPTLLEAADRGFDAEERILQYLVRRPSERVSAP